MSEKSKKKVASPEGIVVNQIVIRAADRSTKDISSWKFALQAAESVYHPIRTRLYDLYADVTLDGHLTGIMQRRVDAVLNKNLHFVLNKTEGEPSNNPAQKRKPKGKDINDIVESHEMRCIIKEMIDSKFYGISGIEFIPGEDLQIDDIPRKHIKPEIGIIAKEQNQEEGWDYTNMDNIWIIGDKKDLGLLLKCAPYALWKRGNMADWAQYVEIFGMPVRVIKYDAYDLKTKKELQTIADESGSALSLLIPKQADFEMMDGKMSNGDGKLQDSLKTACNDEMSVIILTNTETTTSSAKSGYAQSKEHGKQQLEITRSDLKFVENLLNSKKFLKILASYGYDTDGFFEFEKEIDLAELLDRQTIDTFVSQKVPIGDDYYYETYGIPKPENYDELKAKMEAEKQAKLNPPAPQPGNKPPKKKKPKPANLSAEDKTSLVDKIRTMIADFFDPAHVK